MQKYKLTDEHRSQLTPWAERWIANAMRTRAMDGDDRAAMYEAIEGLYTAAKLKPPPRTRIIFVPSPLVMALAGTISAGVWYLRKDQKFLRLLLRGGPPTRAATDAATSAATRAATSAATRDATYAATRSATSAATDAATDAATADATDDATLDATDAATAAATRAATSDATYAATSAATRAATRDATYAATRAATSAATLDATDAATYDATYAATRAATRDATDAATDAATADATLAATSDATLDATYAATDAATEAATSAATRAATSAATRAATLAATRDATRDATYAATRAAAEAATLDATDAATYDATYAATYAATDAATSAATSAATYAATEAAISRWLVGLGPRWCWMSNAGNHASAWCSYISFFRHIAGLDLPEYEKWKHYEEAAIHGSWRLMHEEFCIVSDFPEVLEINEQRRPHCETGPSHRWRDGWSLWHIEGVRVTEQIVMHPDTLTVEQIKAEPNAEVRRIMRERFGDGRYLRETGAKLIHADYEGAQVGAAPRALMEDDQGQRFLVGTDGSTGRCYYMRVPDTMQTCREANEYLCGFDETRIKVKG